MQNWSCMHLCGHSSVKSLWSCDARAQDTFPLFLVNPMFPKYVLLSICAFIRVHFGYSGKFHSIHPLGVHTFFSTTGYDQQIFFFKEELEVISFRKHVGFSARQLIFLFPLFFFLTYSLFPLLALFFFLLALFLFFYFYFYHDFCLFYFFGRCS